MILAGGRSIRMGRDKARLVVDGRPLLVCQVDRLRAVGADPLWISVGTIGAGGEAWPELTDVGWVRDPVADAGPLTGIASVLDRVESDWLIVLAVDLPALSGEFLSGLLERRGPGCGVVPVTGGGMEPLCAVVPVEASRKVLHRFMAHTADPASRSPRRWMSEGVRRGWMREWKVASPGAEALLNWNFPGDWNGGGNDRDASR